MNGDHRMQRLIAVPKNNLVSHFLMANSRFIFFVICGIVDIVFIKFLSFGLNYFRQVDSITVDSTAGHEGGHLFHEFQISN